MTVHSGRIGRHCPGRRALYVALALTFAAVLWATEALASEPVWRELDEALSAVDRPVGNEARVAAATAVASGGDVTLRALRDRLAQELSAQRSVFERAARHRLPAKAALRLARTRAVHEAGQVRLLEGLRDTLAAPAGGPLRAQKAADLRALLAPMVEASRHEPLSSELNVRAPALTPPPLRVAAGAARVLDAPLAVSTIGPVPSQIQALADTFTGPIEAYAWVRNNVRPEFYYGSLKGPLQTLFDRGGNDADSAALLIALLRALGVPARFLQGTAEVDAARLQSITGTRSAEQALRVLERAGIPHEPATGSAGITGARVARVLCEAYVPYANYRGLPQDSQGKLWLPLDPGFKDLRPSSGIDIVSVLGIEPRALVDEYLSAPRPTTPREFLHQRVTAALSTHGLSYEEAINDRSVVSEELGILPNALPYRLVGPSDASYDPPLSHRVRVVGESNGTVVLDATLALPEVLGKRLTLSYVPFDDDDAEVVAQYGSLSATPPYLIEVKPVLKLGGAVVAAGSGAVGMAVKYDLRLSVMSPGGAQEVHNRVLAGNLTAIGLAGGAGAPLEGDAGSAASLLAAAASDYLQRWDRSDEELADLMRVVPVRPTASACFVMSDMEVEYAGGDPLYPVSFVWKGVAVDADLRPSAPVGIDGAAAEVRFAVFSGLEGSILESRLFEDRWRVGSVSTAKALQLAEQRGTGVLTLDRDTVEAALPALALDAQVKADVREAALRGFLVRIPAAPVGFLAWSGVGWWILDEATGESSWMLEGGHSGGVTAAAAIDWPDAALTETLSDQGEAAAPEESLVARIQKFVSTDFQEGVVAKPLARAFRVLLLDEHGQRVPNAQVTFQVLGGGGAFVDPATGKSGERQLVVRSSPRGEAEAQLILGKSTGEIPRFACLEPDPESCSLESEVYSTQVGLNLVAVRAGGADLDEPFTAYAKPDDRFDGQYRYANLTVKTWPAGAAISNLTVAGLLAVNTRDPYENPISNFHVRFAYAAPPELAVPPVGYARARGATETPGRLLGLRDYERCLEQGPSPAYGACPGETATLIVSSSNYGAVSYPVLGDSPYSLYRFDIGTEIVPDFGFVKIGTWGRICRPDCSQWASRWPITLVDVGGRPVIVGPTANLIEAYPPGGRAAMRFNAQAVYEGYSIEPFVDDNGKKHYRVVGNNQWTREPLDDSSFLLTARSPGTGTPASASYTGNGTYEAPMTMSVTPQLNTVGYEARSTAWLIPQDLPDHPDEVDPAAVDEITLQITKRKFPDRPNVQSGAFSLWGVKAVIESVTPQPLGLDDGRVRESALVRTRVEPAAYLAELAPTNLWFTLSREDQPMLSASGTDGSPFRIPAGLAFPPGAYTGQLSIPAVSSERLAIVSPPYPVQSCLPLELMTPVVVLPFSGGAQTGACQTEDRIRFGLCARSVVTLRVAGQPLTAKIDGALAAIEGLELEAGEHQVEVPRELVEALDAPAVSFDLRAVAVAAPLSPTFASGALSISRELVALVTPEVKVKQTVDYDNGTVCTDSKPLQFAVCDAVRATIKVGDSVLSASIDGGAVVPLDGIALGAGLHSVEIPPSVVSQSAEQQKPFIVAAVLASDPRVSDEAEGVLSGAIANQSILPVGHTFVKGVDLFDGHLAQSEIDLAVPGRHLALEMSRTYSSATNEGTSVMGSGWNWSYGLSLHVPKAQSCELAVLSTRDGTQLFRTSDGGATYSAQKGYHGRLVRNAATLEFDYFDKSAVQHHFEPNGSDATELRIAWVREPHGDRLAVTYDASGKVMRVAEEQGGHAVRELRLSYVRANGLDRIKTAEIVKANGTDLGLRVVYGYDSTWGNLDSVTRLGTNLTGGRRAADRQSLYRYSVDNPRDRHQLTEVRRPNGAAPVQMTQYQYYARTDQLPGEGSELFFGPDKEERVKVVSEFPDGRALETRLGYDLRDAIGSRRYTTTVTPPGRPATVYLQDGNGLTLEVREPVGKTTRMSWSPDVRKQTETDANQRLTRYTWDANGNLASETVETGDPELGDVVITRAVHDPLYNVLTSRTDAEDRTTVWSVNTANGDVTTMTDAEGNETAYEYDDGAASGPGLLSRSIDARGNPTAFDEYNDFGQAGLVRDALGNETRRTYDDRGRLVEESDSLGRQSFHEYDGLDRPTRLRRVAEPGSDDVETLDDYYPHGEMASETNANKGRTLSTIDGLGRVVGTAITLRRGVLRTSTHYDDAGNKDLETDRRGVRRRYRYDDLNRLRGVDIEAGPAGASGPLGEVAAFEYDPVGNKVAERDVAGLQTDFEYDRLYRVTKKLLPETMPLGYSPPGRLTEQYAYDKVGNRTSTGDANGHETRYEYDRLNRITKTVRDPGGANLVASVRYCNAPAAEPPDGAGINKCEELAQPGGLRTLYAYDQLNRETSRRVRLEGPDGEPAVVDEYTTVTRYDDRAHAVRVEDPNHAVTLSRLDGLDRMVEQIVDEGRLGLRTRIDYDGLGNQTRVVDPRGNPTSSFFDGLGRMYQQTDARNKSAAYEYDGGGLRIQATDRRGVTTRTEYDNLGRELRSLLQNTPYSGRSWSHSIEYRDRERLRLDTDARGKTTTVVLDGLGRVVKETDPAGHFALSKWDGVNRVEQSDRRPAHHVTTYSYDGLNRLVQTRDPAPFLYEARARYLHAQNQLEETDRRGTVKLTQLDSLARVRSITVAAGQSGQAIVERNTYDGNGNKRVALDAENRRTELAYDGANRLVARTDGAGTGDASVTQYTYDASGNRSLEQDQRARDLGQAFSVKRVYDPLNHVLEELDGEGDRTAFSYDDEGNRVLVQQPKGQRTAFEYDELAKLLTVVEPRTAAGVGVTRHVYDESRNRTSQVDARSNSVQMQYDDLNRLEWTIQPGNRRTHVEYDENGNVVRVTDPNGNVVTNAYDELNRLHSKEYGYVAGLEIPWRRCTRIEHVYDANGNLTEMDEDVASGADPPVRVRTTREFDRLDRLERETTQTPYGQGTAVGYSYLGNGLRKTVTDTTGSVTDYRYDGQNRLQAVRSNAGTPTESSTSYLYWPDGLLREVHSPNGVTAAYLYDKADRLENLTNTRGGAVVSSYGYRYDQNGNRELQVEVNGGLTETTRYGYDALDRLERVTYPVDTGHPSGRVVTYGYDLVGNRTTEREADALGAGTVRSDKTASFDQLNRLISIDDAVDNANDAVFTYDDNGNQRTKTAAGVTSTYVYDATDRLAEVRSSAMGATPVVRFQYDADGRRTLKIGAPTGPGDSGTRQFVYDQTSVLQELDSAGQPTARYEWGNDRLISLSRDEGATPQRRFYSFDALGSITNLTDETGVARASYHLDAWGNYRFPSELSAGSDPVAGRNRFGFTGYLWDQESKLYFAKARFYDPEVGRFTSQDSLLGETNDPPSLHRYFYANDQPTFVVDPTGHEGVPANPLLSPQEVAAALERDYAESRKRREAAAGRDASGAAQVVEEDHGFLGNPIEKGLRWLAGSWVGRGLAASRASLDQFAGRVGVVARGITRDQYGHVTTPEEDARREHRNAQTPATDDDAVARCVLHNTGETFRQAQNTSEEVAGTAAELVAREGLPVAAGAIFSRAGRLTTEALEELAAGEQASARGLARSATGLSRTEPVLVGGRRAIDTAQHYEQGVRELYGSAPFSRRQYTAIIDGQRVSGVADNVASIGGRNVAVEAKYVEQWGASIRNPASPNGGRPWAVSEQGALLSQARRYSTSFDQVIYHTNSPELAQHYTKTFQAAGVTNFRFVITPIVR